MGHEFERRRRGNLNEVAGRQARGVDEIKQERLPGAWIECRSGCPDMQEKGGTAAATRSVIAEYETRKALI
jgi:hypothetical protein